MVKMEHKLYLKVVYDCPTRLVAEYHREDGKVFFCDVMKGRWFIGFNTAEATEAWIQDPKKEPDLIWDGEKLHVVADLKNKTVSEGEKG